MQSSASLLWPLTVLYYFESEILPACSLERRGFAKTRMGDDVHQGHSVGFVTLRGGVEVPCSASPAAMQTAAMNMAAMRSSTHADASNGHQSARQGGSDEAMPSSLPRRLGQGFKRPRQQPPPQQNVTVHPLSRDHGPSAGPAALTTLGNGSSLGKAHGMVQDVVPLAAQRKSSTF